MASAPTVDRGCDHSAVIYRTADEYVRSVVPFITEGLAQKEAVWAAIPAPKHNILREALGAAARDVTFVDITEMGRNPGRVLAAELAFIHQHRDGPVRLIAELIWPGRTDVEYPACMQHEALANIAFEDCDVAGLCPYDASLLDDEIVADIRATHPLIGANASRERSADYAVDAALKRCNQALATGPVPLTYTVSKAEDLAGARRHGGRYGRLLGLSADRIADLKLVITELATNSLQHGGGRSRLAFWEHSGHLVCEVRDLGFLIDPLAGRRPPNTGGPGAVGLFVVNALADLVRTHTSPGGTTIHAYMRLDRFAPGAVTAD